jgi:uncharacterized protein YprB with RNaseH-like and TPR domain
MKKHLVTETVQEVENMENKETSEDIHFMEEWKKFDTKPYYFDGEYILIREKEYPLTTKHGLYELGELHSIVESWNGTDFQHPLSVAGFQSADLFFFDTETTGLGGGTGNTIFLLGYARVLQDKVIIRQLFLPSPASEVALYHYFLQDVDYTTLVTYNGKAFDWPQVKTRHTLIRDEVPKLPKFGHFDLLHASRRIWKNEYESLKLSIVEKEILSISRESDIPGFMAPMIYFHYLEDQNPEGIFGIMSHNETDILTLITLYTHISNKLLHAKEGSRAEQLEVARWLDAVGERGAAIKNYYSLLESDSSQTWATKLALAALCKKEKNMEEAIRLWIELYTDNQTPDKERVNVAIELAKYFEHKKGVLTDALEYAKRARKIWSESQSVIGDERIEVEIEKRINRLQKKMKI